MSIMQPNLFGSNYMRGGSSPPPYPTANLLFDLNPDDVSKLTLDMSDGISSFNSTYAANNASQSTAGQRPVYTANQLHGGTRPAAVYTAANTTNLQIDGASSGFNGNDLPFTLIMRVRTPATISLMTLFSFGSSATNGYGTFDLSTTNRCRCVRNDGTSVNAMPANNSLLVSTEYTITVLFSGTTVTIRANGSDLITSSALNTNSLTIDRVTLGCFRRTSLLRSFSGPIGRSLCYSIVLSGGDLTTAESWVSS